MSAQALTEDGRAGLGDAVPDRDPASPAMARDEFLDWREARRYTSGLQVVADLRAPLATLSNVASGFRAVPPDVARLCRMIELLDDAARIDARPPDAAGDAWAVLGARAALASWTPPPPALRLPTTRRGWEVWRTDRLCALTALVSRVAFATRSAAFAGVRERARRMLEEFT